MYRIACGVAFLLIACSSVRAQDPAIDDLKGKIVDARMAQQNPRRWFEILPGAQRQERDAARDLLAPVYGWFSEGFDTLDLKEAKALPDELG